MKTGQIIRIISNQYTVRTQEGEQLECVAMGKLRKGHSPVVGDRGEVERFDALTGIQRGSGDHRHVHALSGYFRPAGRPADLSDLLGRDHAADLRH